MEESKKWAIQRRELYEVTYLIESEEKLTEDEAKELLSGDGLNVAERFDRSWIEDSPIEEWEALAIPKGQTFGVISERGIYKLTLLDEG